MGCVEPRVSVLIPNFNNGRQSSRDGATDFMGDLLTSLHDTLETDPTPIEIIALDDGSTDDSLATLRDWSNRRWRGGEPFLRLIEAEHCGVLSITANRLVREASGEILVRLDGDIEVKTANWAKSLVDVFEAGPEMLGVVGPKQLKPNGAIHAFGDFMIHPKGYHHVAEHLPADTVDTAREVDHVMGCFYCFRRRVWEELEGFDEQMLRGQTVDFGLRSRLAGYRCVAIPQISFVHRHALRHAWRATRADTKEGLVSSRDRFREKWGFDRVAPDLDVVRQRYGHTPLLWNPVVFARGQRIALGEKPTVEASEWGRFSSDQLLQERLGFQVNVTEDITRQLGVRPRLTVLGCGSGLLLHLLAMKGFLCLGIAEDPAEAALGATMMSRQDYPGAARPEIVTADLHRRLPLVGGAAEMVLIYHTLEHHHNPAGLLAEAGRIAGQGGHLIVTSQRQEWLAAAAGTQAYRYQYSELMRQIQASAKWAILTDPKADTLSQPIVIAARMDEKVNQYQIVGEREQKTVEPAGAGR